MNGKLQSIHSFHLCRRILSSIVGTCEEPRVACSFLREGDRGVKCLSIVEELWAKVGEGFLLLEFRGDSVGALGCKA